MELIRSLVRPIVTVAVLGTVCYMAMAQLPVPDWLLTLTGTIVAWWFADRVKKAT